MKTPDFKEPCLECGVLIKPTLCYCRKCAAIPYPKPSDMRKAEAKVESARIALSVAVKELSVMQHRRGQTLGMLKKWKSSAPTETEKDQ